MDVLETRTANYSSIGILIIFFIIIFVLIYRVKDNKLNLKLFSKNLIAIDLNNVLSKKIKKN